MPETPIESAQIHQLVAFCPVIFATFCVHYYLYLCLHLCSICIYRYLYTFSELFTTVLEVWCTFTHNHITLYFLKTRILLYNLVQFSRWGNFTLIQYSYPAHVHIQNVTSCSSDAPQGGGAWYRAGCHGSGYWQPGHQAPALRSQPWWEEGKAPLPKPGDGAGLGRDFIELWRGRERPNLIASAHLGVPGVTT